MSTDYTNFTMLNGIKKRVTNIRVTRVMVTRYVFIVLGIQEKTRYTLPELDPRWLALLYSPFLMDQAPHNIREDLELQFLISDDSFHHSTVYLPYFGR